MKTIKITPIVNKEAIVEITGTINHLSVENGYLFSTEELAKPLAVLLEEFGIWCDLMPGDGCIYDGCIYGGSNIEFEKTEDRIIAYKVTNSHRFTMN